MDNDVSAWDIKCNRHFFISLASACIMLFVTSNADKHDGLEFLFVVSETFFSRKTLPKRYVFA